MKIGPKGLALIKDFEKLMLKPYKDQGGKWTVGWGHMFDPAKDPHLMLGVTLEQADKLLVNDLAVAEHAVSEYVISKLNQNQFDAIVSFVFNLGKGAFIRSPLRTNLNKGLFAHVADELLLYCNVNKKPSLGLKRRRNAERELFLS